MDNVDIENACMEQPREQPCTRCSRYKLLQEVLKSKMRASGIRKSDTKLISKGTNTPPNATRTNSIADPTHGKEPKLLSIDIEGLI